MLLILALLAALILSGPAVWAEEAGGEPPASQTVTETPAQDNEEAPGEAPADDPSKDPLDDPSEDPSEDPAEEPAEEPTEEPLPHEGHQLVLRPGNRAWCEDRDEAQHVLLRNYELYCVDCGEVIAQTDQREETPEDHIYAADGWAVTKEPTCREAGEESRACIVCGHRDVREIPALPHSWTVLSMCEPTCEEPGVLVRACTVCGEEERLETPALGHMYEWVAGADGVREFKCLICGDVKEREAAPHSDILYNNTITSFGPTTRELIGGTVWNRVTPLDVSENGIFTYPLIASNNFAVGTATVEIEDGWQTVSYQLNSSRIVVHSESLVLYPSLDSLRTGMDAQAFEFNAPIDLEDRFGEDKRLLMGIVLKADYDTTDPKLQGFKIDEEQIGAMTELID